MKITTKSFDRRTALVILLAMIFIAYPLVPLRFLGRMYPRDWENHVWMLGYFQDYIRHRFSLPAVFNTGQLVGLNYPIFYGFIFYPVAALLTLPLDADVALRLIIAGLYAAQFYCVFKTARILSATLPVSFVVSALVTLAIYPMTNLYNRSDVAELIASMLLTMAASLLLQICFDPERQLKSLKPWITGLLYTLALGTHAITAFYGSIVLVLLFAAVLPERRFRRELFLKVGMTAILAFLIISPWLYAMALFGGKVQVVWQANNVANYKELAYVDGVDTLLSRFALLPLDPRVSNLPFEKLLTMGAPFLDAQINLPLFIFDAFLLFMLLKKNGFKRANYDGRALRTAIFAAITFFVFLVLSVNENVMGVFPRTFHMVQFGYRLVTYCDLALLMLAMSLISMGPVNGMKKVLLIPLALAVVAVGFKIPRASLFYNQDSVNSLELPQEFGGHWNYSTRHVYPNILDKNLQMKKVEASIPVSQSPFGEPQPLAFQVNEPTAVIFHILSFPWNRVILNETDVTDSLVESHGSFDALEFQPGTYKVEYRFVPSPVWTLLRTISFAVVTAWIFALLIGAAKRLLKTA